MTVAIIIGAVAAVFITFVFVIVALRREVKFLTNQNTGLEADNIVKRKQLEVFYETKQKVDEIRGEKGSESITAPASGDSVSRIERLNRMQNSTKR